MYHGLGYLGSEHSREKYPELAECCLTLWAAHPCFRQQPASRFARPAHVRLDKNDSLRSHARLARMSLLCQQAYACTPRAAIAPATHSTSKPRDQVICRSQPLYMPAYMNPYGDIAKLTCTRNNPRETTHMRTNDISVHPKVKPCCMVAL